jgi:hypothetical protein
MENRVVRFLYIKGMGPPNPDSYRDLRWRDFAAAQNLIVRYSLYKPNPFKVEKN